MPVSQTVSAMALTVPIETTQIVGPAFKIAASAETELAVWPPVAGEEKHAGRRPKGLIHPCDGNADDLKLIRGIGPQNEGRLHTLGIWHFAQIAAWVPEEVIWIGSYLAFPGRIEREDWCLQAQRLAAGRPTTLATRAKRGPVTSSRGEATQERGNVAKLDRTTKKPDKKKT